MRVAPVISRDTGDVGLAGVTVEMSAEAAEAHGAYEETALDADAAWEANGDLSGV